ncbi:C-type lectin domain family 4 member M-like [Brachionus plicatilis]|uniref:C-type lectin domain family 4 member M-like n=1 Tax=Brachionus plicatilis TaxID=10195 RepID=A0A3M7PE29_BRAPC|nr:C-type lectin domain family 4 member M-like [Brachionus plicatilis]
MGGIELKIFKSTNRLFCLKECVVQFYCHQALFDVKTKECFLFSGYSLDLEMMNQNRQLYMRIYEIYNKDLVYFSNKLNTYLPCPKGFKKFSKYPNSCYHISGLEKKFYDAKKYCEQIHSFLPRTKNTNERELVESFAKVNSHTWVDSFITGLDQEFKWGDGSSINATLYINNFGGNSTYLKQQALVLKEAKLLDAEEESKAMINSFYINSLRRNFKLKIT